MSILDYTKCLRSLIDIEYSAFSMKTYAYQIGKTTTYYLLDQSCMWKRENYEIKHELCFMNYIFNIHIIAIK